MKTFVYQINKPNTKRGKNIKKLGNKMSMQSNNFEGNEALTDVNILR